MSRIAFVSTMGNFWGGSEELWSQSALRLAQQGVTVGANVFGWPTTPARLVELERAGCQVTRRPRRASRNLWQRARVRLLGDPSYRWLDAFQPDLVVISQGESFDGGWWMRECAKRGLLYATIAQNAAPQLWLDDAKASSMVEPYEGAAACYFVSHANLRMTENQLARRLTKARIVRNPFNVAYDAAPPWPPEDRMKLACVGRLAPAAKGQDILFDVMGLPRWRKRPVSITLFGAGPAQSTLRALTEVLGLDSTITFGGFTLDVESIWATHHALIHPSRYEGLPMAIVEALLCQRVCIVTNAGGNAELLDDNVTGFIAAGASAPCLDEAMERAWARRAEWRQIGEAAGQRVRELIPRDPIGVFVNELLALLAAEPAAQDRRRTRHAASLKRLA